MTKFDRRTFLKGMGATGLAASLMGSRVALGNEPEAPLRVLLVPLTHGWGRDLELGRAFTGSEFDFTIPAPLEGLEAIKDQCVFIDGARGTLWGNAHDVSYSDMFTAAVCFDEHGSDQLGTHFPEPMGPSIDHVIARHWGSQVLRVTANYASWGRRSNPSCFDDALRVQDFYFKPEDAYDGIIGPIRDGLAPPMPGRDAVRDRIFEFMKRDTDRMLRNVRGSERSKLEGYVDAFTQLGDRLRARSEIVLSLDEIPDRPVQSPNFSAQVDQYLDMVRLVFQADTHRVAVMGFGEGIDDWQWRDKNGIIQTGNPWENDFHHYVAHHGSSHEDPERARLSYEGWVRWYVEKMVAFTQRLDTIPDIGGTTLLDNTIIMLTGEVGTGNHDTRNKLHILIGGGQRLRRGRWIKAPLVDPRNRNGVFIGGQTRDGSMASSGLNYGDHLSIYHTADVLAALGRLAGVPFENGFGLPANNMSPVPLNLT
ncbi:MAG: DUF1552 domain-containing protein [Bradymonadaceae bacterium]|nr:DUF1552 domain-containing protein [Lujinxingiaceae bacterium]